jgi:hypothetical protein
MVNVGLRHDRMTFPREIQMVAKTRKAQLFSLLQVYLLFGYKFTKNKRTECDIMIFIKIIHPSNTRRYELVFFYPSAFSYRQ